MTETTTYPGRVLDWPVTYWASSSWDSDTSTEFVCGLYQPMSRPDRRCKTGVRTWNEPCHHVFPDWDTPRELLAAIAAHIAEAHGDGVSPEPGPLSLTTTAARHGTERAFPLNDSGEWEHGPVQTSQTGGHS